MEKSKSWAYEVYLDVVQDVRALERFRGRQQIQRSVWELHFTHAMKQRFVGNQYVRIEPQVVYLTTHGLEVLGYSEIGG